MLQTRNAHHVAALRNNRLSYAEADEIRIAVQVARVRKELKRLAYLAIPAIGADQ